ncbi:hypothetical protein [uncultured Desulfobacter sp.]|uniref:hypothetical protein n=1 Tax=uncultured Desulfobacter sp. TaxID=240139 RepID=UPI0037479C8B
MINIKTADTRAMMAILIFMVLTAANASTLSISASNPQVMPPALTGVYADKTGFPS